MGGPLVTERWLIKSIVVTGMSGAVVPLQGFSLRDTENIPIFERLFPWSIPHYTHEWFGGQVVDHPSGLNFVTPDTGWSVRVSGYLLVLP